MSVADASCLTRPQPECQPQPKAWQAPMCGHTAEQFAEVALILEPRGAAWCKSFDTVKAALYRAFGRLLSEMEQRACDLFRESLACESVELLSEWENEYGLPYSCGTNKPTDLAGRQARVCAVQHNQPVVTLASLEALLQESLGCPYLTLQIDPTGICVAGITSPNIVETAHNVVGGWGLWAPPHMSATGQPLTVNDPYYVAPSSCPMIYHSTAGGWTGGVGQRLQFGDPGKWSLLVCLMSRHLPATTAWGVCV